VQDTVLVVPPYPYCIEEDHHDVDLEDCWTAQPQLSFSCHLRPTGRRKPKDWRHKTGPDNLRYYLVFFSTFTELSLPIKGPMEDAGVVKLYEPSSKNKSSYFSAGCADSAAEDGRRGSNVYEVNTWL
jgi:hypothetical protein